MDRTFRFFKSVYMYIYMVCEVDNVGTLFDCRQSLVSRYLDSVQAVCLVIGRSIRKDLKPQKKDKKEKKAKKADKETLRDVDDKTSSKVSKDLLAERLLLT